MPGQVMKCLQLAVYMSATLPWISQDIAIALVQLIAGENDSCIESYTKYTDRHKFVNRESVNNEANFFVNYPVVNLLKSFSC